MSTPVYFFTDNRNGQQDQVGGIGMGGLHYVDTSGNVNDLIITSTDSNWINNGGWSGTWGCCLDPTGKFLYVMDENAGICYQINLQNNNLITAAGGGPTNPSTTPIPATSLGLHFNSYGCKCDAAGNLYLSDLRDFTPIAVNMQATTQVLFGTSIPAGYGVLLNNFFTCALCEIDYGMDFDSAGNMYATDQGDNAGRGNVVYKSTPAGTITVAAGTIGNDSNTGDGGPATSASMDSPFQLSIDKNDIMYIIPNGLNGGSTPTIRAVNLSGRTQTVCGVSIAPGAIETLYTFSGEVNPNPWWVQPDNLGNLYIADPGKLATNRCNITKLSSTGAYSIVAGLPSTCGYAGVPGPALSATLGEPFGIAVPAPAANFCGGMSSQAVGNPLVKGRAHSVRG